MPDDLDIKHAERIAVMEAKLESFMESQRASNTEVKADLKLINNQLKNINDMVQQSKGAGRLLAVGGAFFGVGTAALLYSKWTTFLHWLGQ